MKAVTIKLRVDPVHVERWREAALLEKDQLSWPEREWHSGKGELSTFIRRHVSKAAEAILDGAKPAAAGDVATSELGGDHQPAGDVPTNSAETRETPAFVATRRGPVKRGHKTRSPDVATSRRQIKKSKPKKRRPAVKPRIRR